MRNESNGNKSDLYKDESTYPFPTPIAPAVNTIQGFEDVFFSSPSHDEDDSPASLLDALTTRLRITSCNSCRLCAGIK